jgi:hypothetical protein
MTSRQPVIVPLFATPFAVVPTGATAELNAALAALLAGRAADPYRDGAVPRDALCFRSREDLFDWPEPVVGLLQREMLGGICAAVMAVNRCTEAEFDALGVQTRARFVIVRPNGCVPAMSAPMASWYGVYCVAAPPAVPDRADSAVLRLYAVREGTMFMDPANSRLHPPFSGTHHPWRPVPGQLAVFPAGILHEVALNRAEADLILVTARVRFAHPGSVVPPW